MEPIAEEGRGARSRGGEARGQPTKTEPEASRPACIARGRSTARRGYSLTRAIYFGTPTNS